MVSLKHLMSLCGLACMCLLGNIAQAAGPRTGAFTVGGTVEGLRGIVVLQNNGENDLKVAANGRFTFTQPLLIGATYQVTIKTQPATQTCSVTNGSGVVPGANVTNIAVTCVNAPNLSTIGGTVSGLNGVVVLQNNGTDVLAVAANGAFTFTQPLPIGAIYQVTIKTQPATQTCSVTNGSGTVQGVNVTNVAVTCTTTAPNLFTIGGTVSGLNGGVVLQNNGSDDLAVTANGRFTFAQPLPIGAIYQVTIKTQPATQTCSVTNGSGTVQGVNVTNVAVTCATAP